MSTLLKACLVISLIAGVLTVVLLLLSHAPLHIALILAPYAIFTALRWFGRGIVFADGKPMLAMASDLAYSISLIAGLLVLLYIGHCSIDTVAKLLSLSAVLGTLGLGPSYLKRQYWNLGSGTLRAYWPVWQEYTRWSIMGVVLSELTANAHAYLVTFFAGPKAFAVLAVGALLTRPVSLVLSALPDFERPRMARAVACGDNARALHFVNEFRTAGAAIWIATLGLAAVLLLWFPNVILRDNYDETEILIVVGVWAIIMAARVLRTPESVLLQSAGEFKPLASVSTKSSIASVIATGLLLIAFGPLAALGGILIGELIMTAGTVSLFRSWKAAS
jgi:O-antigen/teichoic acid export membrane protein